MICEFGDPTCPCNDGDICNYVDDPATQTKAISPLTVLCPKTERREKPWSEDGYWFCGGCAAPIAVGTCDLYHAPEVVE